MNLNKLDAVDLLKKRVETLKICGHFEDSDYEKVSEALQILSNREVPIGEIPNHGILVEPYYLVEIFHPDRVSCLTTVMIPNNDYEDTIRNAMRDLKDGKTVEVPNKFIKYMFTNQKAIEFHYKSFTMPLDEIPTPKLRLVPTLYTYDGTQLEGGRPYTKKSTTPAETLSSTQMPL